MELKHTEGFRKHIVTRLLIVPYGIETTCFLTKYSFTGLLIVPYGIETSAETVPLFTSLLLIVPYGIETTFKRCIRLFRLSFNRTLWN